MPKNAYENSYETSPGPTLDFRSDTVTKPTRAMRDAMANAPVGDDYYRDDPSVHDLEDYAAALFGKEAALLTTSGTQSNLIASLLNAGRGDAILVGAGSHTHRQELGGAAALGGMQHIALENAADGSIPVDRIAQAVSESGFLQPAPKLLMLENTIQGRALSLDYIREATGIARECGLMCHLDGARVANAAVACGSSLKEIAAFFHTVSLCLSKGLGAPFGSILVGAKCAIEEARRLRQVLGGGMRQAGLMAAAGRYALENHVDRLAEDHERAKRLSDLLGSLPGVSTTYTGTNIVFATVAPSVAQSFSSFLMEENVLTSGTPQRQRWLTHLDIDDRSIAHLEGVFDRFRAGAGA